MSARPSPVRAAIGGLSLLLVVAMVFQASADARAFAREAEQGTSQRVLAETQPRTSVRVTRKQAERPVQVSSAATRSIKPGPAQPERGEAGAGVIRRPGVLNTSLPPPLA